MLVVGIDPGVKTGLAIYDTEKKVLIACDTVQIHEALDRLQNLNKCANMFVRVEDARKRKWFGKDSYAKQQGAGSVKRDCKIWEDFLKYYDIPHEMIHPIKGGTKKNKGMFEKITGWQGRTSEHARDAAMLVWGYIPRLVN